MHRRIHSTPVQLFALENNSSSAESDAADEAETRSKLLATAYHEAGHAVAACLLGRPIQNVTISPAQMNAGGRSLGACKIQKGRKKPAKDPLEDQVVIQLAGMVAEAKLTGQYCERGAARDLIQARKLLATRAASERQLEKLERRMLDKTEFLLSSAECEKAIELIAHELLEKETISGRAVQHFLKQAEQQTSD